MIYKPSIEEINEVISLKVESISEKARDEMAIPSYVHKNFLIRWLMWKRYECIYELAKLNKDMVVLEFGCGLGLFLPTLCCSVSQVYANDLFPQFAKKLSKIKDIDVSFINDLEELSDSTLDLVIAADVMEHIECPEYYISIFARKLKQDGRLILSGPTENFFYKIGRIIAGFRNKGDYHVSNIEKLSLIIQEGDFRRKSKLTLPLRIPPFLFEIIEFEKSLLPNFLM